MYHSYIHPEIIPRLQKHEIFSKAQLAWGDSFLNGPFRVYERFLSSPHIDEIEDFPLLFDYIGHKKNKLKINMLRRSL